MCFAQQLSGVVTDGLKINSPYLVQKLNLKSSKIATFPDADGKFSLDGDWPDQLVLEVSMATYETKTVSIACCDFLEPSLEPDHSQHARDYGSCRTS